MSSHAGPESTWPHASRVRSVLVVKFGLLGDMLLADAALAAIRERYPSARIRLLADSPRVNAWLVPGAADEQVFLRLGVNRETYRPLYHPTLWLKLLSMRFGPSCDVVVFLNDPMSPYFRRIHSAVAWASRASVLVGVRGENRYPQYTHGPTLGALIGRHELERAWRIAGREGPAPLPRLPEGGGLQASEIRRRKSKTGARLVVALQPLTLKPAKQWPIDRFVAITRTIVEAWQGMVVLVGSREEAGAAQSFARFGDKCVPIFGVGFPELVGVLKASDAFIGHDSGLFHVAVAAQVPVVVLAGAGDPRYYRYGRPHVRVLRRCILASEERECPRYLDCSDHNCLPSLPAVDVTQTLAELLGLRP
jgi:heptosyltransferase-3